MAKRMKMHRVNVRGVGRLAVSGKLPKVTKTVLVEGKRYPITREAFMEAWALSHHTDKSFRELLAERVSEPKSRAKLTPLQKFEEELEMELGYYPSESDVSWYFSRGESPSGAAASIRAAAREREEEKKRKVL
jgi:hypothetical protein